MHFCDPRPDSLELGTNNVHGLAQKTGLAGSRSGRRETDEPKFGS